MANWSNHIREKGVCYGALYTLQVSYGYSMTLSGPFRCCGVLRSGTGVYHGSYCGLWGMIRVLTCCRCFVGRINALESCTGGVTGTHGCVGGTQDLLLGILGRLVPGQSGPTKVSYILDIYNTIINHSNQSIPNRRNGSQWCVFLWVF